MVPETSRIFRRVAGSLVPIVKVGCRLRTATSLGAVHVTAPPCFTEWLAPPGVHTSQNDCFARAPEVKIWSISLLTWYDSHFGLFLDCAPAKV